VPGIQGIDTRALTRKLRVRGALNGFISTEDISPEDAVARAKGWPGLGAEDYVKIVTHREAFLWDEKDAQSGRFQLPRGSNEPVTLAPLPPADIPIVAFDYGMKYNILRRLRRSGNGDRGGSVEIQTGGRVPFQRPGRPRRAGLCRAGSQRPGPEWRSDFWNLSRPPDPGPSVRREDFQTEIRPSRRQSTG